MLPNLWKALRVKIACSWGIAEQNKAYLVQWSASYNVTEASAERVWSWTMSTIFFYHHVPPLSPFFPCSLWGISECKSKDEDVCLVAHIETKQFCIGYFLTDHSIQARTEASTPDVTHLDSKPVSKVTFYGGYVSSWVSWAIKWFAARDLLLTGHSTWGSLKPTSLQIVYYMAKVSILFFFHSFFFFLNFDWSVFELIGGTASFGLVTPNYQLVWAVWKCDIAHERLFIVCHSLKQVLVWCQVLNLEATAGVFVSGTLKVKCESNTHRLCRNVRTSYSVHEKSCFHPLNPHRTLEDSKRMLVWIDTAYIMMDNTGATGVWILYSVYLWLIEPYFVRVLP